MKLRVRRQLVDGKVKALAHSREFGWLPDEELKEIALFLDETTAPAAMTLITEGRLNHNFFVLMSGVLEVTEGGRHKIFLYPGETCGEQSMGTREVAAETVRTVTPARLLVAGHSQFQALGHRMGGEAAGRPAPVPARSLAPNPA